MYSNYFNNYVSAAFTNGFHVIELKDDIIKSTNYFSTEEEVQKFKETSIHKTQVIRCP